MIGRAEVPQGCKGIEVYFSNPDFVFANELETSRLGQGAFAIALKALLDEVRAFRQPQKALSEISAL